MDNLSHYPVMVNEVVSFLNPKSKKTYLDGTFGQGGYTKKILETADCKVLAIDRDQDSESYAREIEKRFKSKFLFHIEKLSNLNSLLKLRKIKNFDGIVLDLGISNTQLNNPNRGFSFSNDGPLDMRMDYINSKLTAEIVVNEYPEKELSDIFFYYGEEKNSRKIARSIINFRRKNKIGSTKILSEIIQKINYAKNKHPATRVFQALRIFINDELSELEKILKLSLKILNNDSRIAVVAFHSLEDRIIKNFFRKNCVKNKGESSIQLKLITKKPITPSPIEIKCNPRSRSAKLRVAEKI
ncbi:MAG: 16S rRNA (cytosine(1402)-N(4))-methyltransferase RsmH [Pseudomonadota bacterium]|nr:16S rRNA (cytosine(1402)-N(4))-methyltransferase RsmH [Pseudomonadota bacterium]